MVSVASGCSRGLVESTQRRLITNPEATKEALPQQRNGPALGSTLPYIRALSVKGEAIACDLTKGRAVVFFGNPANSGSQLMRQLLIRLTQGGGLGCRLVDIEQPAGLNEVKLRETTGVPLVDAGGDIARSLGIFSLPVVMLVQDGTVVFKQSGFRGSQWPRLRDVVTAWAQTGQLPDLVADDIVWEGQAVPKATVRTTTGKEMRLGEVTSLPTVVAFLSPGCPTCSLTARLLRKTVSGQPFDLLVVFDEVIDPAVEDEVAKLYQEEDVKDFFALNRMRLPEAIRTFPRSEAEQFMRKHHLTGNVAIDYQRYFYSRWGITGGPVVVVVDRQGTVALKMLLLLGSGGKDPAEMLSAALRSVR
jgi:thiol-disulfide isomerase/thioredoxin